MFFVYIYVIYVKLFLLFLVYEYRAEYKRDFT